MDTDTLSSIAYEAALVPERWQDFVDQLAHQASAFGAAMFTSHTSAQYSVIGTGIRDMWQDLMAGGWDLTNPRLDRALALQPAEFVRDTDILSPSVRSNHPWFTDFCARWDMGEAAGAFFNLPSDATLILTIERQTPAGPYTDLDISTLNRLRPDLGRAVDLAVRLSYQQYQSQTEVLDALGLPAAVVNASGHLLSANARFESLMPELVIETMGRLHLTSPAANALLIGALERLAPQNWVGTTASIPVPGQRGSVVQGILQLVPIRGIVHDLLHGGACLLVFNEVGGRAAPAEGLLRNLFDLSAAEARVARWLIGQRGDYKAVALELGISVETTRSHAKAVYRKTGLPNAASLVAIGVQLSRGGEEP